MKHVLLVVNSDFGKGNAIGFRFFQVAKALQKEGVQVSIIARSNVTDFAVVTPWYSHVVSRLLNAVRIYIFPTFNHRKIDVALFDYFVKNRLKKKTYNNVDVALFGEFVPNSIKKIKEKNVPVFLDVPIGHEGYSKWLLKEKNIRIGTDIEHVESDFLDASIELADCVISPSEFVKMTLKYAGANPKNIAISPFGVDMPDEVVKNQTDSNEIHVAFAGNVNMRKGVVYMLEAWQKKKVDRPAFLHIYGRVYKELDDVIAKYKDDTSIIFHGFSSKNEIFADKHIFLFPTLLEGSAKAVYEAMSYGLAVITTPNAGSIIQDGVQGTIVPIADSVAIKEALETYIMDDSLRKKHGEAAKQYVAPYTWEAYARRVIDIVKKHI